MQLLSRDNIKVEEVCDYHKYPIADNDTPMLSSDRLEYIIPVRQPAHFDDLFDYKTMLNESEKKNNSIQNKSSFLKKSTRITENKLNKVYSSIQFNIDNKPENKFGLMKDKLIKLDLNEFCLFFKSQEIKELITFKYITQHC